MKNALSDRGVALRRDELLARTEALAIVAEFITVYKDKSLGTVPSSRPNGSDENLKNCPQGQSDGRRRMAPVRSAERSTVLP